MLKILPKMLSGIYQVSLIITELLSSQRNEDADY